MKTKISKLNSFSYNRYGYLWEILSKTIPGKHLDFGAYNGNIINQLVKDGVIQEAIGVDANIDVVNANNPLLENRVRLQHINTRPKVVLPFPDNFFDSVSMLDVLEHVYDQDSLLIELLRVLKFNGILVITVPQKHFFSFLDTGNYKFIFPKIHKLAYYLLGKKDTYIERFVECKNGLFGDIEVEKMWHQHFTPDELITLIEKSGCKCENTDGAGFYARVLSIIPFVFGSFSFIEKCSQWDAKRYESTHLFSTFRKK